MYRLSGQVTRHWTSAIAAFALLWSLAGRTVVQCQSLAPPQFAAYQSVPQLVADHDAALSDSRTRMLDNVSSQSMPDMLQRANHGDAEAMRALGCVYWDGLLSHDADPQHGLQMFERAAMAGNIEALSMIGDHYVTGAGEKPDYDLAKLWYTKGYVARDARSTVGLAVMSCQGVGVPQDTVKCEKLMDQANSFQKKGDALDVKSMVAEGMFAVAEGYRNGTGVSRSNMLAAVWYAKSAALGRLSAAVALDRLYVNPGGLAQDLIKATAVLDSYMKSFGLKLRFSDEDRKDFANAYVAIGAVYEKQVVAAWAKAGVVYRDAANLGYPDAIINLGMRYAQGTGVAQNLVTAHSLLTGWSLCVTEDPGRNFRYSDALRIYNGLVKSQGTGREIPLTPCPAAVHDGASGSNSPPSPVQPRFPNIVTQNIVTPLQKFPVFVSLNTKKLDAATTIISATNQQNGELMLTMPDGMTSILIEVSLVSPHMTAVDGQLTRTIEMTVNKDSTTAAFQLQAGSATGVEPIFVTMTYNGEFLAMVQRDVTVAAATPSQIPVQPALETRVFKLPPIAPPLPTDCDVAASSSTATPQTVTKPASAAAKPTGFAFDPEARAADITVEEIRAGASVVYTVRSPLFPGKVWQTVDPNSGCRKSIVEAVYRKLETKGAALALIHGKDDVEDAREFAQGLGDMLYDRLAPDAFKTVYEKLKTLGAPPRTIAILTEQPLLPWELMRPRIGKKPREDFLGLTVSVVHRTSQSIPLTPPPTQERLDAIAMVIPQYTGSLALPATQIEMQHIQATFPGSTPIGGTSAEVRALAMSLPDGIIHYAGHGIVVAHDGAPPDTALVLNGPSIDPATWFGLAENSNSHPFYFFNACDLGQAVPVLNYVEGWGPTLMRSGASGYLGAMWKVSDTTAGSFSGHFYTDLKTKLTGSLPFSIADVVTQARRETYAERADPTALAYVLYSAPYQTLVRGDATNGN